MPLTYKGQVASAEVNGEFKLTVECDGVAMTAPLDAYFVPFADITDFEKKDNTIHIKTGADSFAIARLGSLTDAFFDEMYAAYNAKVRASMFVQGSSLFKTRGEYQYDENDTAARGTALIEVYRDCVLILPPDAGARRVPLCFLSAMEKDGFALALRLDTGESYRFMKLGYDTAPFAQNIEKCLYDLRENALKAVRELDGSLNPSQLSAIAKRMPEGAAAPLGCLYNIAPSFAAAVEDRIAVSRVADEYLALKEIGGFMRICVGMKSGLAGEDSENILWLIAPGQKHGTAAVELVTSEETAAATFIYHGFSDWDTFRRRLNQAMEAIGFRREVIRLTDDELTRPDYADMAMAVRRNGALRFIRSHFAGRVIHSSPEHWKRELFAYLAEERGERIRRDEN